MAQVKAVIKVYDDRTIEVFNKSGTAKLTKRTQAQYSAELARRQNPPHNERMKKTQSITVNWTEKSCTWIWTGSGWYWVCW